MCKEKEVKGGVCGGREGERERVKEGRTAGEEGGREEEEGWRENEGEWRD